MQSRLAAIVLRNANFANYIAKSRALRQGVASAAATVRTADPAIHFGEDAEAAAKAVTTRKSAPKTASSYENDPIVTPEPPHSSLKLESNPVTPPPNPSAQQKRSFSSEGGEKRKQREEDVEYFKHHKASPLSNLEFADTRKPIRRATDSTVDTKAVGYYGGGDEGVVVWRPEQLDTAEEALERAMSIWRENKMKGDPDSPHGRVLRELRGEL
ncbi:hypothetical protein Ancab_021815 [Ancistrocladus abbreviatus]